jgi:hypothetical protein
MIRAAPSTPDPESGSAPRNTPVEVSTPDPASAARAGRTGLAVIVPDPASAAAAPMVAAARPSVPVPARMAVAALDVSGPSQPALVRPIESWTIPAQVCGVAVCAPNAATSTGLLLLTDPVTVSSGVVPLKLVP